MDPRETLGGAFAAANGRLADFVDNLVLALPMLNIDIDRGRVTLAPRHPAEKENTSPPPTSQTPPASH